MPKSEPKSNSRSRRDFLGTAAALSLAVPAAAQTARAPLITARTQAALDRFGMRLPIWQAGFGRSTTPALAAAVANAGGMGAMGSLNMQSAKTSVEAVRAATKGPFLVNMILQQFPTNPPDILPQVLDAGATIVQFSWGIPSREAIAMIRAAHALFGMQVTSRESARLALDSGADFLICQGTEAGGHVQAHHGLYESLPAVIEDAKQIPVIASGGISNGAAIQRALAAGASGANLGTRFVATRESGGHPDYKQALIGAKAEDTSLTLCFQDDWIAPHRVISNSTFRDWEAAGCPKRGARPGEGDVVFTRAGGAKYLRYSNNAPLDIFEGRIVEGPLYAGTGVGAIKDVPSAGDLIKRLWAEAEAAHRTARA